MIKYLPEVKFRIGMVIERKIPQFKCLITDAMEDYDSGAWEFFRHYERIMSDIGQLFHTDSEWKENYTKLLRYYSDIGSSLILKRKAPDPGFMRQFISSEIENTDPEEVLMRAKTSVVGSILRIGSDVEMLTSEFLRIGRIPRFSESFSVDKFEGLQLFAKVLYSRGIDKSKE